MNWEPIISWLADNAIALLALLIAGWSAIYTYMHSGKSLAYTGKSLELQNEAFALEKKKARENEPDSNKAIIVAELLESGGSAPIKIDRLRFINQGKADARKVKIYINGISLFEHPDLEEPQGFIDNSLKINSGKVVQFKFKKEFDLDEALMVRISWDDNAGKQNEIETELELK